MKSRGGHGGQVFFETRSVGLLAAEINMGAFFGVTPDSYSDLPPKIPHLEKSPCCLAQALNFMCPYCHIRVTPAQNLAVRAQAVLLACWGTAVLCP
jgi:hypothetical protein